VTDQPTIRVMRRGNQLAPLTDFDADQIARYPAGKALTVSLHMEGTQGLRQAYYVMRSTIEKACGTYQGVLDWDLKRYAGFIVELQAYPDGRVGVIPMSTKDMDEAQLRELIDRSAEYAATQLGIEVPVLRENYRAYGMP
jgi:hypothetical protein